MRRIPAVKNDRHQIFARGKHLFELAYVHATIAIHGNLDQAFFAQANHAKRLSNGEVSFFRCHDLQPAGIRETCDALFGQRKAVVLGFAVKSHVKRLMVSVGSRVHERGLGPRIESEQAAEHLTTELFQHNASGRDLPIRHALIVLESELGAECRSLVGHEVVERVESRILVVDQVGNEVLLKEAVQVIQR